MPRKSSEEKDIDPPEAPEPASIEPLSPAKTGTRMFQTGPGQHEHLTRADAKKKGFFWKD